MVDIFIFCLIIILVTAGSVMMLSWMRGRQALKEIKAAAEHNPDAARHIAQLTQENDELRQQLGRLAGRLATVEQIVTDPAQRTAREIEALR